MNPKTNTSEMHSEDASAQHTRHATTALATEDKNIAIIAYITVIGLIIAFIMNNEKKAVFPTYHIKQSLGIALTGLALFVVGMIPVLGWIVSFLGSLGLLYLWITGLMNAINGRQVPVPWLGEKFEEWFKNI
ncbi:DUF4870 domain-containing protein [Mesonia ostreae]|uniref:DUF4870 domain-containing protein n=1 Tax=Mesonia ostreae TaxID=861110 RepID=A0ABU2KIQ8_9FLAO|nr:hypothetical protein [Mesonia ostreae]MDT0294600.1 hypothetical protein [Mesonia ostreae]